MKDFNHDPHSTLNFSKVGNGYRNVCWIPGKRQKFGGQSYGHIMLFGYDKSGNPKTFKFPFCPSVKYEVKHHTEEIDLYGKFVETRYFYDTPQRTAWVNQMESSKIKIISNYNPEQEFLLKYFHEFVVGKKLDDKFNQQKLRIHFIDIEVAIENEFPEPDLAKYPINLITVYDNIEKKFISWALSETIKNTIDDLPVELRQFSSERELLRDYLSWHKEHYPDVITGWNIKYFDIIYIINRMCNVLGKKETMDISPVGKFRTNIEDKKNYGKKFAQIKGISCLDLLFLYRDKFKIKQALDGGYNLDNVASVEIDDAKLHYDGSMLDFYKSNFQKFWEYNVQDVNLVVKLEEKLKLLSIVRKITTFGCSQMESIYTTISYIISSLDIYARNEFNRIFISHIPSDKRGREADQYEGAFVFPTQAGLYLHGIAGVDFNSLYPSVARVLNLSPETLVGMLRKNDTDLDKTILPYTLIYTNGTTQDLTQDGVDAVLNEACTIARNGALFYKHEIKSGIFANWCANFFKMRKSYKKLLAECEEKMSKLDATDESAADLIKSLSILAEYYDATQYALKILINSAYGTLGTTYSPLYDTRLAEAITLTGQFANRSTSEFLNKLFVEKYEHPSDVDITISGDTDSVTGDMDLDIIINSEVVKI